MSTFGFPSAVTALAHHGTGFSNSFTVSGSVCDLDYICDKVDEILAKLELVLNIGSGTQVTVLNNRNLLHQLLSCCHKQDEKFNAVFAAIQDLRRELLRGNRDIRR